MFQCAFPDSMVGASAKAAGVANAVEIMAVAVMAARVVVRDIDEAFR